MKWQHSCVSVICLRYNSSSSSSSFYLFSGSKFLKIAYVTSDIDRELLLLHTRPRESSSQAHYLKPDKSPHRYYVGNGVIIIFKVRKFKLVSVLFGYKHFKVLLFPETKIVLYSKINLSSAFTIIVMLNAYEKSIIR